MARIDIKNLNMGGIADSDYLGAENSVAEMVGLDIHSVAGLIKLNQKLVKDSGSTVTEFCRAKVSCSNGSTYWFGDAGGIYERTSGGTWSKVVNLVAPAAGSVAIKGAAEHDGYIYYAMQSRLGRIAVPAAGGSWAGRDDNWATFTNADADWHPMKIVNLVLYIGDGNLVAQVEDGVFTANALDLKIGLRIKALGRDDTNLLIGTFAAANVAETEILSWNTWSVSYSVADTIPEVGINAFLEADNIVIINAGVKGNTYTFNGSKAELYVQIKGDWSSTNKAVVHPEATFNFNGLPLFGLSQQTGTGVNLGVYSLGRTNRKYPYVLNLDFPISERSGGNLVLTGIEIGAIVGIGDQFLVSWKNGSTYGVDLLSLTLKIESGYFITRVASIDRLAQDNFGSVSVPYRSLPASTAIKVHRKVNHAVTFTEFDGTTEMETDTDRMVRRTTKNIGEANTVQVKVELTPNSNATPEVERAIIEVNVDQ